MHRSYQPINPSSSKLLQKRWDESSYDIHRRKLQKAKPVVNNKPPQTYMHLHTKLKKIQTEEERLAEIERDNRLLLEKMSSVMRTRGRIDNLNNYDHKSLNKIKRQREMIRVTSENQQILRRISSKEPHYKHQHWDDDWRKNQQLLGNITKFPKYGLPQLATKTKRSSTKKSQEDDASTEDDTKTENDVEPQKESTALADATTESTQNESAEDEGKADDDVTEAITQEEGTAKEQDSSARSKMDSAEANVPAEAEVKSTSDNTTADPASTEAAEASAD